ncbi:MAG: ATP-binding protein [Rhodobacteraceae bacterium]|nr:ATP-binding protein [Paracoccaceae bacterium]
MLILLFPVIMTQLVLAAVFIQKHHDRVTRQMVANVVPHLRIVLSRINSATNIEDAREKITPSVVAGKLTVVFAQKAVQEDLADKRLFYDFSGLVVIDTIREALPSVTQIDLTPNMDRSFTIRAATSLGNVELHLARNSVSPSNPQQLLILMAFTGIILTAIAYAYLRNQLKPIIRLAAASKAFGKGQRIELAEAGATEVREATRAFLGMRDRIDNHIEQRTQMLSNISHDLKTPLTRLRVGLELLEKTPETAELIADVKHMTAMVEEFLEFSRDSKLEETVLVDVNALADQIVDGARRPERKLSLVMDTNSTVDLAVNIKPSSTRRAVQNLVLNAFDHASETRLTIRADGRLLTFIVEDNGPGIPEDQRELACSPFVRLDSSRSPTSAGGIGLGLSIAEDAAINQGGSLSLASSSDLGGLKATLSLPISSAWPRMATTANRPAGDW